MSDDTRQTGGVPSIVQDELTGTNERIRSAERIAELAGRFNEFRSTVPTREDVRREVTGARQSVAEAVDKRLADLHAELADVKPKRTPAWQILAAFASVFVFLSVTIWQASARISDLSTANALLARDIQEMRKQVERAESDAAAARLAADRVCGGKP